MEALLEGLGIGFAFLGFFGGLGLFFYLLDKSLG